MIGIYFSHIFLIGQIILFLSFFIKSNQRSTLALFRSEPRRNKIHINVYIITPNKIKIYSLILTWESAAASHWARFWLLWSCPPVAPSVEVSTRTL